MSTLFEKSVERIERFYEESEYDLGWRFLTCSKDILEANPIIALITLNPGGNKKPQDDPWKSCEGDSSYLREAWGKAESGKSPLQIQIIKMFEMIVMNTSYSGSPKTLWKNSLSGYFVPFRSPRLVDLRNRKEALNFGEELWADILKRIHPKLFICIDKGTNIRLKKLIEEVYQLSPKNCTKRETGWGNVTSEISTFGNDSKIRLLRLPHLSTYKLFSRDECKSKLDTLFRDFCSGVILT